MADKKYLDRDAVLDVGFQTLPLVGTSPAEVMGISRMSAAVYMALRNIPAADVVPVVRCKDCRYCCKEDEWTMWCMGASPACLTTPEDYCSHGKRKEI